MKTKQTHITLTLFFLALLGVFSNTTAQQKVNVKTLFALLPPEAFTFMPTIKPAELVSLIDVCDYKNGYLSLENKKWEMCHWNLKNGNKLIAVNDNNFSQNFYLYANGKIHPTNEFGIREMKNEIENSAAMNCCDNFVRYHIPRQGTSLFANINGMEMSTFKWKNERFVRFAEYPKHKNTYKQLFNGFAAALTYADADRCLQFIHPNYVSKQCMGMFEGRKEQFLIELISGQDEKGAVKPTKLSDIKRATYRPLLKNNSPDKQTEHYLEIELKNGRKYSVKVATESVNYYEELEPDSEMEPKLLKTIPYIIGAVG